MNQKNSAKPKTKRTKLSQSQVPAYSLTQALRVPEAIAENYASAPTKPLDVAKAMELSPTSSGFKMLTGASIAYGLTTGGYNAQSIELTDLGRRITRPTAEGMEKIARKEALLKPTVVGDFLRKYDQSQLPKDNIIQNVLESMGVPRDRLENTQSLILDGASSLGLLTEIKGKKYVNLSGIPDGLGFDEPASDQEDDETDVLPTDFLGHREEPRTEEPGVKEAQSGRENRVFITHGKNKDFVEPIRKLLTFGNFEAVVSVEKQSVSKPVPDKVMDDMRACGAAIIHVADEEAAESEAGKTNATLNPNVLIEIGAAMALYGRRFILLVRAGLELPSNLQGLYEVRYIGETLDADAAIRLMEAINEMKNLPLKT